MVNKQSKSAKNYKRNKKHVASKIKSRKIQQQRNREEVIKNKRLLEEADSDHEQQEQMHEQQYLQMTSKSNNSNKKNKKETAITGEDVAEFLKNLRKEESNDKEFEKEQIEELIKDIKEDDPYILDMTGNEPINKRNSKGQSLEYSSEDNEEKENDAEQEEDSEEEEDDDDNGNMSNKEENAKDEDSSDEEFVNIINSEGNLTREEEDEKIDPLKKQVTREMILQWISRMGNKGDDALLAAKQLILAFLSAVSGKDAEINTPYQIVNKRIYQRVIVASTKYLSRVFNRALNLKSNQLVPKKGSKSWKQIHNSVLIYLKSLCLLLESISDEQLLEYVLRDLQLSIHLFGNFPRKVTRLLHCLLSLLSHEKETIRFSAFLSIHKMATIYPFPFISTCLKGVYFSLVEKSSQYRAYTHVPIEFMKNCVVELCGIDISVSYKYAFMSLRELAVQLRGAYDSSKPHAYLKCYNWTFLNCLHVWVKVFCTYQKQDELRDLIYPLVQIIAGCVAVNSTTKYFNARLKCVSMLNELMTHISNPKLYIPVLPHLFGILNSELGQKMNKKYHVGDAIDLDFKLRMRTSQATTVEYQRHILESTLYYLIEFFALNSRSISFPELAYPAERFLSDWKKKTCIEAGFKKKVKTLILELRKNAELVMDKRQKVNFSPLDVEQSQNFMNKIDQYKEKTPLEKLYEFERNIRNQEIVERIQARLGKNIPDLDKLVDGSYETDSDEELTNEQREELANPLPSGAKPEWEEDEEPNNTASIETQKKRPRKEMKSKKEPAKKKRKKQAGKDQDLVMELNLKDF